MRINGKEEELLRKMRKQQKQLKNNRRNFARGVHITKTLGFVDVFLLYAGT